MAKRLTTGPHCLLLPYLNHTPGSRDKDFFKLCPSGTTSVAGKFWKCGVQFSWVACSNCYLWLSRITSELSRFQKNNDQALQGQPSGTQESSA